MNTTHPVSAEQPPVLHDVDGHIWWWEPILAGWSNGAEVLSLVKLHCRSGPLFDDDTGERLEWSP